MPANDREPRFNRGQIKKRLVISLADSSHREPFFAQAHAEGFEVFPAVDGRGAEYLEGFDSKLFGEQHGHAPLGGEMGAALSHARAMARFGAEPGSATDYLLLVEDDVVFPDHFDDVVGSLLARLTPEFVVLADPFIAPHMRMLRSFSKDTGGLSWLAARLTTSQGKTYRVGHVSGPIWGGSANLVSRGAAARLNSYLSRGNDVCWVADDYNYWAPKVGIDVEVLRPRLVSWMGESEIADGRINPEWEPTGKSWREKLQLGGRLRRFRWSLEATVVDLRGAMAQPEESV